ncbi:MAG TPA: hypothetical protein VLN26_18260, partial [Gaiellaceae bacterium]|nr:hypothetical protein [Gaiellaceae bacterium]
LVTLDQLGGAMREQAETGTPFTDVLVRDGILSADDLARVLERAPAHRPAPEPEPEPVTAAPEPEPGPEPAPAAEAPTETFVPVPELPTLEREPEPEPEPFALPEPLPPAAVLPEPGPAPAPEPGPAAVELDLLAPVPEPLHVVGYVVRGRLVNGEDIEIAAVGDAGEAQRIARDAMRACARSDGSDWPILNGRYVRPESIVSIEVAESLA